MSAKMEKTQAPKNTNPNPSGVRTYEGSCHCGAVRFAAELDLGLGAGRCNCTLCIRVAQTGVMVKPDAFRLLAGAESVSEYRVGESKNARYFCKRCGIQTFGKGDVPEIGGLYVSVNANCLHGVELAGLPVVYWDGRHDNWEAGPGASRGRSPARV